MLKRQQQMTQNGHAVFQSLHLHVNIVPVAVVSRGPYERSSFTYVRSTLSLNQARGLLLLMSTFRLNRAYGSCCCCSRRCLGLYEQTFHHLCKGLFQSFFITTTTSLLSPDGLYYFIITLSFAYFHVDGV